MIKSQIGGPHQRNDARNQSNGIDERRVGLRVLGQIALELNEYR
jgi:hypothetical protein